MDPRMLPTPQPIWRRVTPTDWDAYLSDLERERKLYPGILMAVSTIETGHLADRDALRDTVVSPAGAQGYWQFMPQTAKRFGYADTSNRWDGARAAADYLAWMRDTFAAQGLNPTPDLLGAGYNAGEGAVLKYGGTPPYKETQRYAARMRELTPPLTGVGVAQAQPVAATAAPPGPALPSVDEMRQRFGLAPPPKPLRLPSVQDVQQRFRIGPAAPVIEGQRMARQPLDPAAGEALAQRIAAAPSPVQGGGLPPGYRIQQEVGPAPGDQPGLLERIGSAFGRHEGLSENALDWMWDRVPVVNPLTGKQLTPAEKREARVAFEEWAAQRDGVEPATDLQGKIAEFIGIAAKEMADPAAIMTMGIGGSATGLARLGKMFLAGAGYEAASSTVEQAADRDTIDPGEVATRAAIGGAGAAGLDQVLRLAGAALRRMRQAPGPAAEPPAPGQAALDGPPERLALPAPAPEPLAVPVGEPTLTPAPRPVPPEPRALPAPAPERMVTRTLSAAEAIEQAAERADPEIAAVLRRQATVLRQEAAGVAPELSAAEQAARRAADVSAARGQRGRQQLERLRRIDPGRDDLLTAVRKLGGIDTALETDWAGRFTHLPRRQGLLGGIERPGKGRSLDDLTERLNELGYLQTRDQGELANLLDQAETGRPVWSTRVEPDRMLDDLAPYGRDDAVEWVTDEAPLDPAQQGMTIVDFDDGTQGLVRARELSDDDWTRIERERAQWEADQAAEDARWAREAEIERRAEAGEPVLSVPGEPTATGPAAAELPGGGRPAGPGPGPDDGGAGAAGQADRGAPALPGRDGAEPALRAGAAEPLSEIDTLLRPKLSELAIEQTVDGRATGRKIPADVALKHVDDRLSLAARLIECLRG